MPRHNYNWRLASIFKTERLSENKPHVARVRGYNNFSRAIGIQNVVVKNIQGFSTYRKFVFQREEVLDMRSSRFSYRVSCHVAASMIIPKADWKRLPVPNESIGSFLLKEIDLNCFPPALCSKMPDKDLNEMKKRIHSVEARIVIERKLQN